MEQLDLRVAEQSTKMHAKWGVNVTVVSHSELH